MNNTVMALLAVTALVLFFVQWWNDRQWKRLLERLPGVRARMRQEMREILCLDCAVGEPHACRFMTEAEYAESTAPKRDSAT